MKKLLVFLVIMFAISAGGFWWYQQADQRLSEAPSYGGVEVGTISQKSIADFTITLPFGQLQQRANAAAPKAFDKSGNGPDVCKKILTKKVCVGTKYSYRVTRGNISLSRKSADTLRLSVPVSVNGKGGFRGDGAKLLGLDAKNFRAGLNAYADVYFSIDNNWCPKPRVTSGFSWTDKAKVEIVHKAWVDVSGAVEGSLRDQLTKMGNEAVKSLTCNHVRGPVSKIWSTSSTAFNLPDKLGQAYINITPLEANFPGINVNKKALEIPMSLTANAEVSDQPIAVQRIDLPQLQKKQLSKSRLSLSVPISISYEALTNLLVQGIVNKTMTTELVTGSAIVTARELNVYPSEGGLTVGAFVNIDLPNRLFDVKGWVYLTAIPIADKDGRRIIFSELSFSRELDNEIWQLASTALENSILEAVQRESAIDLNSQIEDAKTKVVAAARKGSKDFLIDIGNPSIRLEKIIVGKHAVVAQALYESDARIQLR